MEIQELFSNFSSVKGQNESKLLVEKLKWLFPLLFNALRKSKEK
jgi:hypothetical protein